MRLKKTDLNVGFIRLKATMVKLIDPRTRSSSDGGFKGSVDVRIKRVYEPRSEQDGKRILVVRLWPRGLTKEKAGVDLWLKDIAPTTELRKWFGHDPARWNEFQKRYHDELKKNGGSISVLKREAENGRVTLLFGTKDEEHNEAVVLRSILKD